MISLVKADGEDSDNVCCFFFFFTDDKRTITQEHLQNGSIFYEIDTAILYVYDADDDTWIIQ